MAVKSNDDIRERLQALAGHSEEILEFGWGAVGARSVLAGVTESKVEHVFKGVLPFIFCDVIVIIMLFIWPQIALFLPSHMF